MDNIKITAASVQDYQTVQSLGKETFHETFAEGNTEADMQNYLSESFSDQKIIAELSNQESMFFIAWEDDAAIGYLKINTDAAQTELQESQSLEIERIYVKATHHGKKVGQLLYNKAVAMAKELNKRSIWLGVWEQNTRAIRFYEKNGFVTFGQHLFKMGNDEQTDLMMRMELL